MAVEITIQKNINFDRLAEEIRAQDINAGVRFSGNTLAVFNASLNEATIQSIVNAHDDSVKSTQQVLSEAKTGLRNKVALSKGYAGDIALIFNTILDQTENRVVQPTRYNSIRAAVDSTNAAILNRFNADLLAETGIDASDITTEAQRRNYCLYARVWINPMVVLLQQS